LIKSLRQQLTKIKETDKNLKQYNDEVNTYINIKQKATNCPQDNMHKLAIENFERKYRIVDESQTRYQEQLTLIRVRATNDNELSDTLKTAILVIVKNIEQEFNKQESNKLYWSLQTLRREQDAEDAEGVEQLQLRI